MSATQTAYRTGDAEAIRIYEEWKAQMLAVYEKRKELSLAVGRDAWVNGSGYSTHIVGFARFDSDQTGDTLHHDDCLIVSSKRGQHNGMVVPNLRRGSGKQFQIELRQYTTPNLDLPGLPQMHLYSTDTGQMVLGHAVVFEQEHDALFALWGCDDAPMGEQWEKVPLSVYYAAREQWEADIAAEQAAAEVSGNTDEGEQ